MVLPSSSTSAPSSRPLGASEFACSFLPLFSPFAAICTFPSLRRRSAPSKPSPSVRSTVLEAGVQRGDWFVEGSHRVSGCISSLAVFLLLPSALLSHHDTTLCRRVSSCWSAIPRRFVRRTLPGRRWELPTLPASHCTPRSSLEDMDCKLRFVSLLLAGLGSFYRFLAA